MKERLLVAAWAEFAGTAMLLCAVIGSGIMAERLSNGNLAIALLANTLATVFALYVLIETLGPVSGAHFNPAVEPAHRGQRVGQQRDRRVAAREALGHDARADDDGEQQGRAQPFTRQSLQGSGHRSQRW